MHFIEPFPSTTDEHGLKGLATDSSMPRRSVRTFTGVRYSRDFVALASDRYIQREKINSTCLFTANKARVRAMLGAYLIHIR